MCGLVLAISECTAVAIIVVVLSSHLTATPPIGPSGDVSRLGAVWTCTDCAYERR